MSTLLFIVTDVTKSAIYYQQRPAKRVTQHCHRSMSEVHKGGKVRGPQVSRRNSTRHYRGSRIAIAFLPSHHRYFFFAMVNTPNFTMGGLQKRNRKRTIRLI